MGRRAAGEGAGGGGICSAGGVSGSVATGIGVGAGRVALRRAPCVHTWRGALRGETAAVTAAAGCGLHGRGGTWSERAPTPRPRPRPRPRPPLQRASPLAHRLRRSAHVAPAPACRRKRLPQYSAQTPLPLPRAPRPDWPVHRSRALRATRRRLPRLSAAPIPASTYVPYSLPFLPGSACRVCVEVKGYNHTLPSLRASFTVPTTVLYYDRRWLVLVPCRLPDSLATLYALHPTPLLCLLASTREMRKRSILLRTSVQLLPPPPRPAGPALQVHQFIREP